MLIPTDHFSSAAQRNFSGARVWLSAPNWPPPPSRSKPVTLTYRTLSGSDATATYAASGVKGWGSLNLYYHFKELSASGRLAPFVTAGGTIFVRDGLAEAINYGGGISFWKNRHRGWRLEYRKHVVEEGAFISRLRSVRIGLVFR